MNSHKFLNVFLLLQKLLPEARLGYFLAIWRATIRGGLVAALPYLFVTIPIGLLMLIFNPVNAIAIALLPLVFSLAGAVILLFAILLPLGAVLARIELDTVPVFALAGTIGGMCVAVVMFCILGASAVDALLNAVVGGIAGTVTGASWGRSRQSFGARTPAATGSRQKPNPIHELIY